MLPNWPEPSRFRPGMQEANPVAMVGEFLDPEPGNPPVKRRVQENPAVPRLRQPIVCFGEVCCCAIPRPGISRGGVQIEGPEHIEDPPRCEMRLRFSD